MKYFVLCAVAGMFNFVEGTIIVQCFPDALPFAEKNLSRNKCQVFYAIYRSSNVRLDFLDYSKDAISRSSMEQFV